PGGALIHPSSQDLPPPDLSRWRDVAEGAGSYLVSNEAMMALDMWLAVGRDRQPPSRRDLRPEAIAAVLADTWLMDYAAESRRLTYRSVGENVAARYDIPLVGKPLDETIAPGGRDRVMGYFLACVETPAVGMVLGRLYHATDRPGYGERLLLPLLTPDGKPEGLLGITLCKATFASRPEAEDRARRLTVILPLDGSPPSETVS
ncbi:MAG TPA: PAS domain-containing protein, partial [Kiloniellaceae bacterium]|nr:PAS domain-containing protein [Kiloniellaceae bacterium]